nr:WYL domain-containing protein [Paenibacillus sinopodophylli]
MRGMIEKFIGLTVQIIYNDRNRNVSIRTIQVRAVRDGRVKAYCHTANAPRIFNIDNIIDVDLVKQHA